MQRHWMPLSNGTMGATLSKSCSRAGALLLHAECEMERHVLSVIPDRSGWVLVDGGLPVEWFRTRQGAIAFGEVKAYKLFRFTGTPSALAVFVDDTTSMTEVQYG